ncbi:hypothetical protein SAMN05444354_10387 [Stigmatella aurantiaca]|uniref:Lipoprotein n=1 Tax=Stigmatella aurantiaca TaxID=41 RepID=A0A1H7L2X0_STIAU|nr:hypothetical protein [Stigmatella aurantiaca]SEK92617.1 hypothetical protein SAMN05444354_10387 [Stigmatella aurantiaca]
MKKLASMFAVACLVLAGCGGNDNEDLCDDLSDSGKDLYEKSKACSDGEPYEEPTDADREQCEEAVKSCSDSEKDKIRDFGDCLSKLPTCTPATAESFSSSLLGCFLTHLSGISEECGGSISDENVREAYRLSRTR